MAEKMGGQAGLEVAYNYGYVGYEAAPQVSPDDGQGLYVVQNDYYTSKFPVTPPPPPPATMYAPPTSDGTYFIPPQNSPLPAAARKKRMLWILGACVFAVLLIVGAVLGGVLGSRAAQGSKHSSSQAGHNGSSDSSSDPSNTTATKLLPIMEKSKLAVTGWINDADGEKTFEIRLLYQGNDHKVRMSTFRSADEKWGQPQTLDLIKARPGTPLGITPFIEQDPRFVRAFYADESNTLRALGFKANDAGPSQGLNDPIGELTVQVHASSRIATYWPFVFTQDVNGALRQLTSYNYGPNISPGHETYANRIFPDTQVAQLALGGGFVALNAAVKYNNTGGFIYVNKDRALRHALIDNLPKKDEWSWGSGGMGISIPGDDNSNNGSAPALGAFTVGRAGEPSTSELVDTYVLFQDATSATGDILTAALDRASPEEWRGPQKYDALSGADKGTDIACVTQMCWNSVSVNLTASYQMARCYFQVGRRVKEVQYDGTEWNDLGFLPID